MTKPDIQIVTTPEGGAVRVPNGNDDLYTVFSRRTNEPIKACWDPNEAAALLEIDVWDLLWCLDADNHEEGAQIEAGTETLYCRIC